MPRPSPSDRSGRYSPREIALRIERMRVREGVLAKEVAADVGLSESAWSKKMALRDSSFSIPELGRICDYFSKKTGRGLVGWPFVDEAISDLLDALSQRHS